MTTVFRNAFVRRSKIGVGDRVRVHSYFGEPWQDYDGVVTKILDDGRVVVKEGNGTYMAFRVRRLEKIS